MLISAIFRAAPLQAGAIPADQGRALRSLFLSWITLVDPAAAQLAHDGEGPRPYTVSNLLSLRRPEGAQRVLSPQVEVWWRVTTFEPGLSKALLSLLDPHQSALPLEFSLGEQPFRLLGATCDPQAHPWAGQADFTSLTQDHLLNLRQPDPRLELHFASPVSFHSERKHLPFPLPGLVARRWLEAWNAYAPTRFPDDLIAWVESSLAVSRYRLESAVVDAGAGKIIGFTGHCAYHMLDRDPYWSRLLCTLAAFAFYCGTGVKTTTGMGQTRLQPPTSRRPR